MQKIIKRLFFIILVIGLIVLADIIYISLKDRVHHKQVERMLPIKMNTGIHKDKTVILFYSEGCPHCEVVEKFINENKLNQNFDIRQKEVHDDKNLNSLIKAAQKCQIETDIIGVPFLWDGTKCLTGDQDIINYFNEKINEK